MSPPPTGVIHDIGYRDYDGHRVTRGAIVRALVLSGLRSAFGLGRSAKSKVLPFILLGLMLVPALIIETVLIFGRQIQPDFMSTQPLHYTGYAIATQAITGIFLASQAPVLFSRDLRFRTISLYFSRPLTRGDYVIARYLALFVALLIMLVLPLVVMYLGGLLAELPFGQETRGVAAGLVGVVILALLLTGLGGLVSALSVRRGFAVAGIITVGMVTLGFAGMLTGIGQALGNDTLAAAAGLLSPVTVLDGVQSALFDHSMGLTIIPGDAEAAWGAVYTGAALVYIASGFALLQLRYRKVSAA